MTSKHGSLPALAAAATGLFVGAAMVATRSIALQIGPGSLALLRYTIGCLCLIPIFLVSRRTRVRGADAARIGLLGVLQFAVVVGLLNVALQRIPSARAALLFSLCPVLTLALEAALLHRRPAVARVAGVVLALGGVAAAFGWEALAAHGALSWTGEGAALLSALVAAVCTILYRPYLERYGALAVGVYALPAAVVVLCVVAAFEDFFTTSPRLAMSGWIAVLFIGISSGVGYLLWLWALKHASPTRVTIFLTLNPIAAAALGALFLGEHVSSTFGMGLTCVVVGVWMAYRLPRTAPA